MEAVLGRLLFCRTVLPDPAFGRGGLECARSAVAAPRGARAAGGGSSMSEGTPSNPEPQAEALRTFEVLGTRLLATDYEGLIGFCGRWKCGTGPVCVDFSNTHIVTMRRHDEAFRRVSDEVDWFVPDGMPLVWRLNRQGAGLGDRVYGPTFMRKFLSSETASGRHYLIGGSEAVGQRLRETVAGWNPGVQIVGSYHGAVDEEGRMPEADEERVLAELDAAEPDFIWVGLGAPKQYAWILRYKGRLKRGVVLAVGFAFDVNAGTKRDAPMWMQRLGLTWLFRLLAEPRRLALRYLKYNTLFLWYLLRDGLGRGRSP